MREHGTKACYVFGPDGGGDSKKGCRCHECRAAQTRYESERQQRIEPAYVHAGPARDHIAWLTTQGVGLKQIVKVADVSQGALWKLVYGKRRPDGTLATSKRIRKTTLDAILAVTPADGARGSRVPAGPTWELVDQLVKAGVPKVRIAERCGQHTALQIGEHMVTRKVEAAVKAMARELAAGTLVTVRRSRHGDTTFTPTPPALTDERVRLRPQPGRTLPDARYDILSLDDADTFIDTMATLLEQRIDENDWRRDAACRGRPTWMFFPGKGDHETATAAKKICSACFVRERCLAANLHESDGVFGGLSARERRNLRRKVA